MATKKIKPPSVNFQVRIPLRLKDMIIQEAQRDYRNMNQEIFLLLCRALDLNPATLEKNKK